MIMCWTTRAVLALLLGCLSAARGQCSPCPGIFKYIQGDGGTVGQIDLPAADPGPGPHIVRVGLSLKAKLPTSYKGKIEFKETSGKISKFTVNFPLQSTLPKVTSISQNRKLLCSAERENLDGPEQAVTNFKLVHTMSSPTTSNKNVPSIRNRASSYPCGIPRSTASSFIVNGLATSPGDWPWLVTVNFRNQEYQCTGALVSNSVVLTAAHCVFSGRTKWKAAEIRLEFGVHDRVNDRENVVSRHVKRIELPVDHGVTNPPTHDLAILVLDKPVEYSNTIIPVCLWSGNRDMANIIAKKERGSVVGWGIHELGNDATFDPQLIKIPFAKFSTCRRSHQIFNNIIKGLQYCAGTGDGRSSVCNGDSGGGMFFYRNNHWELKGILSFGVNSAKYSCDLLKYVVFTDVTNPKYTSWIEGIIEAV